MSSVSTKVLSRISLFLIFLDHAFTKEALDALKKCRRYLDLAHPVLQALLSMSFADKTVDTLTAAASEENEDTTIGMKVKLKSQRKNKQAKRLGSIKVDAKLFQNIHVPVPDTSEEAEELARSILDEQKHALEVHRFLMRRFHITLTIAFPLLVLPQNPVFPGGLGSYQESLSSPIQSGQL